ncbi:MAG TPA: preprotein translocase subunit TatB [Firmicutes bacterium]|nr:preprotein translocase subunit TatB [Bacillota bacterium]
MSVREAKTVETNTVDARGLSCPQPVILARRALEEAGRKGPATVEVLVDTEVARENVTRAAEALGWRVEAEELLEGECRLVLTR